MAGERFVPFADFFNDIIAVTAVTARVTVKIF